MFSFSHSGGMYERRPVYADDEILVHETDCRISVVSGSTVVLTL